MKDEFEDTQLPEELLRALRAPGTPEELAGEDDVLAAYRRAQQAEQAQQALETQPTTRRLRLAGRLGAGGAATLATVVLGSGVAAAAYTQHLPDPVQELAHRVLAPIGVPAAQPRHRRPEPTPTRVASAPTVTTPTPSPSRKPTRSPTGEPSRRPSPSPTAGATVVAPASVLPPTTVPSSISSSGATATGSSSPTGSPTRSPSSSPTSPSSSATGSPTSSPTRPSGPLPASVTLELSATRVDAGSTVSVTGTVIDADGAPVARQRVWLQANTGSGWARVATARTSHLGIVSLTGPAVVQNVRYRLRLTGALLPKPLLSSVGRVTEVPEITAGFDSGTIRISVPGAQAGDVVRVALAQGGRLTTVGTSTLDSEDAATFPVEPAASKQRFVVLLPRSSRHASAKAAVVVPRLARVGDRGGG